MWCSGLKIRQVGHSYGSQELPYAEAIKKKKKKSGKYFKDWDDKKQPYVHQ